MTNLQRNSRPMRCLALFAICIVVLFSSSWSIAAEQPKQTTKRKYVTRSIRGRVVWLAEAMQRLHGVKMVSEAAERVAALETSDGKLFSLVEDLRGRSFRSDKRLRGVEVELLVRQYVGAPSVQVIQVFAVKKDGKYEVFYWCDICAITMFELKPCDCCQGPIELRQKKDSR